MEWINRVGAVIFTTLFILRAADVAHGAGFLPLLLAVQSGAAAFLLVFHRKPERTARWELHLLSWFCAYLPMALRSDSMDVLLVLPGLFIAVLSLLWMGRSFSISPDDRGLVRSGPYRFVRHPMYAGEIFSFLGICLSSASAWNWTVFLIVVTLLVVRIHAEEKVMSGYESYKKTVKWRLLPHVW